MIKEKKKAKIRDVKIIAKIDRKKTIEKKE